MNSDITDKDARVAEIVKDRLHPDHPSIPFISAPTYETDGIVKVWVRGLDWDGRHEFQMALRDIWGVRDGTLPQENEISWLRIMLEHEIPGDYARALLEVNDNE